MSRNKHPIESTGFTLVELLIVLAIIALMLSIAAPRYFGSLDKSKEVALQENLKVMRITIDKFYADKGRYPETLSELVEEKYLRDLPVDPLTDSAQTWIEIRSDEGEDHGVVDVRSGAPDTSPAGVGAKGH